MYVNDSIGVLARRTELLLLTYFSKILEKQSLKTLTMAFLTVNFNFGKFLGSAKDALPFDFCPSYKASSVEPMTTF